MHFQSTFAYCLEKAEDLTCDKHVCAGSGPLLSRIVASFYDFVLGSFEKTIGRFLSNEQAPVELGCRG